MEIEVRFADARLWRYVLRGLAEYLDVVGIRLHPDEGLRLKAMDPSHVMLVDLMIPRTAFDEYKVEEETVLTINLELASKALRRATKNDRLVIRSDGSKITFGLVSKGGVERYFTMPLLAAKYEEIPELSLELQVQARTLGPSVASALSILSEAGEVLKINVNQEGMSLVSSSELGEIEIVFSPTAGTLIDYQPPSEPPEFSNAYSLEYFEFIAKIAKLSETIAFKLSPEMPCEIDAELSSGALLKVYVAPRVE